MGQREAMSKRAKAPRWYWMLHCWATVVDPFDRLYGLSGKVVATECGGGRPASVTLSIEGACWEYRADQVRIV